jgi:hypothetical protein
MADCSRARAARASKTPKAVHRYASPRKDPQRFARDIAALVQTLDPVLIVPTCEEVFYLAALVRRGVLDQRLFAPSFEVLAELHAKGRFIDACRVLGLPVPGTWRATADEDLRDMLHVSTHLVFKPEYSRFGARAVIGPEPEDLTAIKPTPARAWIIQQRIYGEDASFYAVAREGKLTAFCAYRSSWRLKGGVAYAFAPLDETLAAQIHTMAEVLAGQLVIHGQFACDLVVDEAEKPWLIECNPRAVSGVHLFPPGPDLANAILGRGEAQVEPLASAHIGAAMWRYGLPAALSGKRLDAWKRQRAIGRDVLSAPGDRGPVLGALIDSLGYGLRAAVTDRTLAEAMTADMEWNGEPL